MLIIALVMGIFSLFEMRGCERNLKGQQELANLISETYNPDGTRKDEFKDDIDALMTSVKDNPLPTYAEAQAIVENAEIVNEGTPYEFVKGCFSLRYKNALMRLEIGR